MSDDEDQGVQVVAVNRNGQALFRVLPGSGSLLTQILHKSDTTIKAAPSNQGVFAGRKEPPFDIKMLTELQISNTHHATCVHAKVAAIAGLGFRSPSDKRLVPAPDLGTPLSGPTAGNSLPGESTPQAGEADPTIEDDPVSLALDDLCDSSFLDVLCSAVEDFVQTGNGYIEVVRKNNTSGDSAITGIHHLPAVQVAVVIEDQFYNKHFEISSLESVGSRRFAEFGDLDDFVNRAGSGSIAYVGVDPSNFSSVSEVIHLKKSTSLSRFYGWPDSIASVAAVELMQCVYQHNYDFFLNRGVPEFMFIVTGGTVDPEDWKKVVAAMQSTVGLQNASKTIALNLKGEGLTVKVEKLALEGKTGDANFSNLHDTLALAIVSAHRVPHLLAGIQIPGKLGAANELPNALMAFQTLVCGPAQETIAKILKRTLGNPLKNGGLMVPAVEAYTDPVTKVVTPVRAARPLNKRDFVFREIIDRLDVGKMDTVGRMKTPLAQAQAQGRDPADGLLKSDDEAIVARASAIVAQVQARMAKRAS